VPEGPGPKPRAGLACRGHAQPTPRIRRHASGTELPAQPFPEPHWVATSADWRRAGLGPAARLGHAARLGALDVFTGRATWPGTRPLATVYSGHQFGVWAASSETAAR
jgi:uncharacterized protein YdiU (UPF0061 family)